MLPRCSGWHDVEVRKADEGRYTATYHDQLHSYDQAATRKNQGSRHKYIYASAAKAG